MNLRVVIPGGDTAPGRARRALTERLAEHLPGDVLGDMQLLVTEIVANGVRHGGVDETGEIDLRIAVAPDHVRVEMRDSGIQLDPRVRAPDLGGGGGFGMVLVARMSRAWGVDHEPNVVMWFELPLLGAGTPETAQEEPVRGRTQRGFGPLLRLVALPPAIQWR